MAACQKRHRILRNFSENRKRGAPSKMTNVPNFSGLSPASFDSLLLFLRVQIQDPVDIILRRLVVLYLLSRLAILRIQSLFQRQQLAIFCIQLLHIWNLIHLLEGILFFWLRNIVLFDCIKDTICIHNHRMSRTIFSTHESSPLFYYNRISYYFTPVLPKLPLFSLFKCSTSLNTIGGCLLIILN